MDNLNIQTEDWVKVESISIPKVVYSPFKSYVGNFSSFGDKSRNL